MEESKPSHLLKQATRINHQQLEKAVVQKIKKIETRKDYIELLQHFHGYFGALEEKIDRLVVDGLDEHQFQRRKATRLANDIETLGGTVKEKASEDDLPSIENYYQALGALYVIEGSTLGGRVIVNLVKKQLKDPTDKGFSFFNGYGDETENRWAAFKNLLDEALNNKDGKKQLLEAADATFEKFKAWIEKNSLVIT